MELRVKSGLADSNKYDFNCRSVVRKVLVVAGSRGMRRDEELGESCEEIWRWDTGYGARVSKMERSSHRGSTKRKENTSGRRGWLM